MESTSLKVYNRAPRNCFESEAARIHAIQPEPLPVVFVIPATDRACSRRQRRLIAKEQLHLERWEKFRNVLRKRYSAVAETTAMYHVIEFWECWLCGFDAYQGQVLDWWQRLHFDIRRQIIHLSRKHGRDQLNRRWLMKKAVLRATAA